MSKVISINEVHHSSSKKDESTTQQHDLVFQDATRKSIHTPGFKFSFKQESPSLKQSLENIIKKSLSPKVEVSMITEASVNQSNQSEIQEVSHKSNDFFQDSVDNTIKNDEKNSLSSSDLDLKFCFPYNTISPKMSTKKSKPTSQPQEDHNIVSSQQQFSFSKKSEVVSPINNFKEQFDQIDSKVQDFQIILKSIEKEASKVKSQGINNEKSENDSKKSSHSLISESKKRKFDEITNFEESLRNDFVHIFPQMKKLSDGSSLKKNAETKSKMKVKLSFSKNEPTKKDHSQRSVSPDQLSENEVNSSSEHDNLCCNEGKVSELITLPAKTPQCSQAGEERNASVKGSKTKDE